MDVNEFKPAYVMPNFISEQELYKKIHRILNRLTSENFQKSLQEVIDIGIDTEEKLAGTVEVIFEKAIGEPNLIVVSANLCRCLHNLKVPTKNNPKQYVMFSKLLLNRCQSEFQKPKADALDVEEMQRKIEEASPEAKKELIMLMDDKAIAEEKARRCYLGNIQFIGELYKLKMLTENIMHDCLLKLLRCNDEDSLEAFCLLLTTIGWNIDHEKSRARVDAFVTQLRKIVDSKKTSIRLRNMILDVISLRKCNWVPRQLDQDRVRPAYPQQSGFSTARNIGTPRGSSEYRTLGDKQSWEYNRNQKTTQSGNRLDVRKTPQTVSKQLSSDEIRRWTDEIMDEYLSINDLKETILCIRELDSSKMIHVCVHSILSNVVKRSKKARHMASVLLREAVKCKLFTTDQITKGLMEVLEYADDMANEMPQIWKYLGELIGPLVEDDLWPITNLKEACKPLIPIRKAGIFVAQVLHDASQRLDHVKVGEAWRANGMDWNEFVPRDELQEFISKQKLEFTVGEEAPRSQEITILPMDRVGRELERLIIDKEADNEEVFDWVIANVTDNRTRQQNFIRALMTAVCSSAISGQGSACKVELEKIKKRCMLLQRYLDYDAKLELQALYALQALVHKLGHPPDVLQVFFNTMYDEDIFSEDAFYQWESSTETAEMPGKGVAVASVVKFFTWLREADEEKPESAAN